MWARVARFEGDPADVDDRIGRVAAIISADTMPPGLEGARMLLPVDRWPPAVQDARVLPYIHSGSEKLVALLPQEYRPNVAPPPGTPGGTGIPSSKPGGILDRSTIDMLRTNPANGDVVGAGQH